MAEPAERKARASRRAVRPHHRRFLVIYGLLAVVLVAGIAGVVLWAGRAINPAPAWSAWKPSGGGLGAAKQIATHVGRTYRLPGGKQLVDVVAKGPTVFISNQQVPFHFISLRRPKRAGDLLTPIDSSNTAMFSLCGLGPSCAITTRTPLVEIGPLLRREILELSLYTLKYIRGVSNVIAYIPPTSGSPPLFAVYFEKSDLSQQLKVPLVRTLSPKVPRVGAINSGEQRTIDSLMQPRLYKFSLAQTQQADTILVLTRFTP